MEKEQLSLHILIKFQFPFSWAGDTAHHNSRHLLTANLLHSLLNLFFQIIFLKSDSVQGLTIFHLSCSTYHRIFIHSALPFYFPHSYYCHSRLNNKWHDLNSQTSFLTLLNTKGRMHFLPWFLLTWCIKFHYPGILTQQAFNFSRFLRMRNHKMLS